MELTTNIVTFVREMSFLEKTALWTFSQIKVQCIYSTLKQSHISTSLAEVFSWPIARM